jgi:hypothetical protein
MYLVDTDGLSIQLDHIQYFDGLHQSPNHEKMIDSLQLITSQKIWLDSLA